MAFFKFRKGEGESVTRPTPSESVEAMRRRARQRLIGAAVLVLAGIVGFPLLFDSQPRPVAVDIPIEIPDRQRPPPLAEAPARPGAPVTSGPAAAHAVTPAAPAAPAASAASAASAPTVPAASAAAPAAPAPPSPASPQPPANASAPAKPAEAAGNAAQAATAGDDAARARALLEGRTAVASADERFVVQVGAFAEAAKAREVRQKLERAGVKTYVHVAETKDGPRIRVRVGPFANRAEADKAVQKIKGLDLPAAILSL